MQQQAAQIRIRAEHKLGVLLQQMDKQGPGQYKRSHDVTVCPSLAALGIGKMQSPRWQKLLCNPQLLQAKTIGLNDLGVSRDQPEHSCCGHL